MQWQPGRSFKVRSKNFVISRLTPELITDRMLAWFDDPDVTEFFIMPKFLNRERFIQLLNSYDNINSFFLVIHDRQSGAAVGFFTMYVHFAHGLVRTGICIGDKEYWGRGVVHEVRGIMLDFIFTQMRMNKVYSEVDARNFPSIFNYKSMGFRNEGFLRKEQKGQDGKWHDYYRFALLREEWLALKAAKKNA